MQLKVMEPIASDCPLLIYPDFSVAYGVLNVDAKQLWDKESQIHILHHIRG